jgi:hypothetical protein
VRAACFAAKEFNGLDEIVRRFERVVSGMGMSLPKSIPAVPVAIDGIVGGMIVAPWVSGALVVAAAIGKSQCRFQSCRSEFSV